MLWTWEKTMLVGLSWLSCWGAEPRWHVHAYPQPTHIINVEVSTLDSLGWGVRRSARLVGEVFLTKHYELTNNPLICWVVRKQSFSEHLAAVLLKPPLSDSPWLPEIKSLLAQFETGGGTQLFCKSRTLCLGHDVDYYVFRRCIREIRRGLFGQECGEPWAVILADTKLTARDLVLMDLLQIQVVAVSSSTAILAEVWEIWRWGNVSLIALSGAVPTKENCSPHLLPEQTNVLTLRFMASKLELLCWQFAFTKLPTSRSVTPPLLFVMTAVGVICVVLAVGLLLAKLEHYSCFLLRAGAQTRQRVRPQPRAPPIALKRLSQLPLALFRPNLSRIEMSTCMICLEQYSPASLCRLLPCGHIFHPSCIDPWLLSRSARCPCCQQPVAE